MWRKIRICSSIKNLDEYVCFMYTEDKSRLAENLMKTLFKCINSINVVDYGPEVFNI